MDSRMVLKIEDRSDALLKLGALLEVESLSPLDTVAAEAVHAVIEIAIVAEILAEGLAYETRRSQIGFTAAGRASFDAVVASVNCGYCVSQPNDPGCGCSCDHAPCVHDRNRERGI